MYGTELNIYDKQEKCLLKSGSYDLILQELGSKFNSKKDGCWETAMTGKVSIINECKQSGPVRKYSFCQQFDSDFTVVLSADRAFCILVSYKLIFFLF